MTHVKNTVLVDPNDADRKYKINWEIEFDDYIDYLEGASFNGSEVYIKRFLYPTSGADGIYSLKNGKTEVNGRLQNISRSGGDYFIESIGEGKRRGNGFLASVYADGVKSDHYVELVEKRTDVQKGKTADGILHRARKFFLVSLAEAVRDLHENGIVHASLSPFSIGVLEGRAWLGGFENSFIERRGQKPVRAKRKDGKVLKRKCEPFYSPELARFAEGEEITVDRQTDIFSLGVFIHWYLSGCFPTTGRPITWFPSGSLHVKEYTWKCWDEIAFGGDLNFDSRISPNMQRLLHRMLRCESRSVTAQEVLDCLERMSETDFAGVKEERSYETDIPERRFAEPSHRGEGAPSVSLKGKTAEKAWESRADGPAKKPQPPVESEKAPVTLNDFTVEPAEGFIWNTDKIGAYKGWRIEGIQYYLYPKNNVPPQSALKLSNLELSRIVLKKTAAPPPVKEISPVEISAEKAERGGQVRVEEEKPRVEHTDFKPVSAEGKQPPVKSEEGLKSERAPVPVEEKTYETPKAKEEKTFVRCKGVSGEELVQALAQIVSSLEKVKALSLEQLSHVEIHGEDDPEETELNATYALLQVGEETYAALTLMQKAREAIENEE